MTIFQSTIERALYFLLGLVILLNVFTSFEVIKVQISQNQKHTMTNATLIQIETQMKCISEFFNQPGPVRAVSSTSTLTVCNDNIGK